MDSNTVKSVAVIVAHPDDETLWAGGTILENPLWDTFVIALSRASDANRAPKFFETLKVMGVKGAMADLEDNSEQTPLNPELIRETILRLLPPKHYDLILSHNPNGEYTRHLRHEEVSRAVIHLWHEGKLSATKLWTFAYEDGDKKYYPRPIEKAPVCNKLPKAIWQRKYNLITETYGYEKSSFEAKTTPVTETFWQFSNSFDALQWITKASLQGSGY
jgi:LmbE family N-acetylglucosaminyl deacetylase